MQVIGCGEKHKQEEEKIIYSDSRSFVFFSSMLHLNQR